jgi:hypothetical protein
MIGKSLASDFSAARYRLWQKTTLKTRTKAKWIQPEFICFVEVNRPASSSRFPRRSKIAGYSVTSSALRACAFGRPDPYDPMAAR